MKKKYLAALLAAAVMTAALAGCGGQASQTTESAAQESETQSVEAESTQSQAAESTASESTVESTVTETPTPEPTEAPAEPDYSEAYAAYLATLRENESQIRTYDWQNTIWENDTYSHGTVSPVALADVYGDETPELLFMQVTEGGYSGVANLTICTYEGGEVKTLYNEALDLEVAGGTNYCVFYGKDKSLYIYDSIGDEGIEYKYSRLAPADGAIALAQKLMHSTYPNETYDAFIDTYYIDGDEVSHEDYERVKASYYDNIDKILLSGDNDDEVLIPYAQEHGIEDMTYDEAIAKLTELSSGASSAGDQAPANVSADDIFAQLNGVEMTFASGVGAWSSDLKFDANGVFYGSYHDSNMGDAGDGYDATIYICDYTGRFEIANIINSNSFTLRLVESTTENQVGEEWIEDNALYVASDPYGIKGGEEFILYLPGTPTSELTEDAINWYTAPRALGEDEMPATLPCYGLYNVTEGSAYYSYEQ